LPIPSSSPLDRSLGMLVYASTISGIGGRIRSAFEDFIVEELAEPGVLIEGPSQGDYVLALIEKRGMDTFKAALKLAERLRIPLSYVTYAGLKDASAVTVQRFSIKGLRPEALEGLSIPGLRVLRSHSYHKPLARGELYGNRFTVTIREVRLSLGEALSRVRAIMASLLKLNGFPNFYGYQRFGTRRPNTHVVGKLMLLRRYEEAVREFLFHAYPGESEQARKARMVGDYRLALKLMPKTLLYERRMLKYLINHPNDYLGALKSLPRPLLRLMVEAFQAYIFNKALSLRIEELADSYHLPFEGDFLIVAKGGLMKVKEVNEALNLIKESRASLVLPLPSYELAIRGDDYIPRHLKRALDDEGISLKDFKVDFMPGIKLPLRFRSVTSKPKGFTVVNVLQEPSSCTLTFRFTLERGVYATSLLRELMKPEDPLNAGF